MRISDSFSQIQTQILPLLEAVPRVDVKDWNDRYASDEPGLTDRLFGSKQRLPMQEIFEELKATVIRRRS